VTGSHSGHTHGGPGAGVEEIAAGHSAIHHLDPRAKIVGLIGLAIVSVSTPPGAWVAFAAYLAVLVALAVAAQLPLRYVLVRMTVEVPFLLAAAILPLTVPDGAVLGGTVAAKATIGVLAMVLLSSTTPFPRLLAGFERLGMPRVIVMIVAFMWRYLHVIGGEVHRAKIAREARGYDPRWLWQTGAIARNIATLFVRSLERGERVYLAMASRGYRGGIPAAVSAPLELGRLDVAFAAALAATLACVRVVLV